ncbi:MAG: alcohol dehydrogenase catalytic domain-containing protein [Actinobacteria bacterium]|nr:alcohol dehydrogenase catalytic domain-containing protein [Actinomycetota bacterium]
MQAVVFTSEARVALADRPEPVAGDGEVLIKVGAVGICGTDLHAPVKPEMFTPGVVLGHEFAGTVARPAAGPLSDGQPVVVNPIALSCGRCQACRRGFTNQCLTALAGCSGVARDGGMAQFAVADQRSVHEIPENVALREAAWTEPLAVALRALGLGGVRAASTVAVLGAGAIGQLILQLALNAGAGETVVIEPSRLRRDVAVACGAAQAVSPAEVPRLDRAYDVVFDCTGAADAFAISLALVAPGGRVVVLGSYPSPISLGHVPAEASVVFSSVYRDDQEFAAALRLLARGLIDTRPLTTAIMPLPEYEKAFASLLDPEQAVKVFLDPVGQS